MSTIVVDPITRIEGHLRIEAETDANGVITRAMSSGTMMRGIEIILRGRDPRDAWAITQRICGVCTIVHSIASIRAVENALEYPIPPNARLIRNILAASQIAHDQVVHFYQLSLLDWVDITSAAKADPVATAKLQGCISDWPNNTAGYFESVRQKLVKLIASGQLGIFANGYWGHPQYKLPPEVNLMLFAHYLEALEWQRKVVKLHAIFGGRNPHPNFVIGGVPCAISSEPNGSGGYQLRSGFTAVDAAGLALVKTCIDDMQKFIAKVYYNDTITMAKFYPDWFKKGEGIGNFLTFGDFPEDDTNDPANLFIPRGAILNRDLSTVHPVDLNDPTEIQEFVANSWYDYSTGKDSGLHPYDGETTPSYTGPVSAYQNLAPDQAYSWEKTPRWKGHPMEVGALPRVLMLYAKGNADTRGYVNNALSELKQPLSALYSTLGRLVAQSIDTRIMAERLSVWYGQLTANIARGELATHNAAKFDPATWPASARGVGFTEAPRGGLGHWLTITDGKISNYQCVVPSTWNSSPRDHQGQASAYEAALVGHSLAVADKPLEILRTIHSFNPCMACAVHLTSLESSEVLKVKVC
jgi:hydrogenase large subunit